MMRPTTPTMMLMGLVLGRKNALKWRTTPRIITSTPTTSRMGPSDFMTILHENMRRHGARRMPRNRATGPASDRTRGEYSGCPPPRQDPIGEGFVRPLRRWLGSAARCGFRERALAAAHAHEHEDRHE